MFERYEIDTEYHQTATGGENGFGAASDARFATLKKHLKNGRPVIVHVHRHYIVATGYSDRDQEMYFNDPQGVKRTISYAAFQKGIGTTIESKEVWDGRMLILKPQIYRLHLTMKANYDDSVNNGAGMFFHFTDTNGNQIGANRHLNIFRANADDGDWHSYYWRLDDNVVPSASGAYRYRLGMNSTRNSNQWVLLDTVKIKRYFNGSWHDVVRTYSVRNEHGIRSGTWYLKYRYDNDANPPKFRTLLGQRF